jgi:hypothetical protein
MKHSWENMKLSRVLSQYREEIWVDDTQEYPQLTNSKCDGIGLRGKKMGAEIGRKRQFVVNLDKYPNTITFTRQTIQVDEAIGLCPPEVNGCIVTENMPLFSVKNAEPKFIEYFFKTRIFLDQLHKTAALGTSQQSVHEDIFLNYEIPLPPLPEQQGIVSKIENAKQRIEQIKNLRTEQQKEIQNFLFSIFTESENTFSKKNFGSFLIPSDKFEEPVMGKNYRQVGVRWWGGGAYERETIDGSQTSYKSFVRLEKNNFLFNKIWVRHGALAVVKENTVGCYASGEFPTYTYNENAINPKWIDFIINLPIFWQRCSNLSQGTSGKNRIKPNEFLKMGIPLPPIEEQNRIVFLLDKLNLVTTNHTDTDKLLTELTPSLLEEAFKG